MIARRSARYHWLIEADHSKLRLLFSLIGLLLYFIFTLMHLIIRYLIGVDKLILDRTLVHTHIIREIVDNLILSTRCTPCATATLNC